MSSFLVQPEGHHVANSFVHRLNNEAANFIEAGRLECAVPVLVNALNMQKQQASPTRCRGADGMHLDNESDEEICKCPCCSLDFCLTYSYKVSGEGRQGSQSRPPMSDAAECTRIFENGVCREENDDDDRFYIHRQPIRIPQKCIREGHNMGLTLPLILTFNLALSYHLIALRQQEYGQGVNTKVRDGNLQKILVLYELAYKTQMEGEEQGGVSGAQVACVRFTMILANNLADLHHAAENNVKQRLCLQHLLSTLMFVVTCQKQQQERNDRTTTENYEDDDYAASAATRTFLDPNEFDGFLRNTSQLILQGECAGAA